MSGPPAESYRKQLKWKNESQIEFPIVACGYIGFVLVLSRGRVVGARLGIVLVLSPRSHSGTGQASLSGEITEVVTVHATNVGTNVGTDTLTNTAASTESYV